MNNLKIIVADNFKEFGRKIDENINMINCTNDNNLISLELVRFNNGEGKAVIKESIRDKDIYILSDVSNYSVSYSAYGKEHHMGPDEHFCDILRILSAISGHASKITVVMPYLFESRQDKRDSRESLDCAIFLRMLESMGVREIVTCDVHNKAIMNAVPNMAFENVYLGDLLLIDLLTHEKIDDFSKIICISPDEGAMKRARFFSELLGNNTPVGSFYKQRDYSKVVDGMNPIKEHHFLGPADMEGRIAIISDDMIASGGSILDTAMSLKKLGVEKIYLLVTFALFTSGVEKFDRYYKEGIIDRVYASNVCYVPDEYQKKEWFKSVDCSYKLASLLIKLHKGNSISRDLDGRSYMVDEIKKIKMRKREL